MNINNPYAQIIQLMRRQGAKLNPPSVQLAVVVAPPPDIVIKCGNIEIKKENILISDYLLKGYSRQYEAKGNLKFTDSSASNGETSKETPGCIFAGQGSLTVVSHQHTLTKVEIDTEDYSISGDDAENDKCFKFTDTLKKNDILAVMPTLDTQTYIILAKVVKPE